MSASFRTTPTAMPRPLAIATVAAARPLDEDLPPLVAALEAIGIEVQVCDWDDPVVDWSGFELVLLRSTWDYAQRLPEFLAWCAQVSARTSLLNPADLVRWNSDKHYLRDLSEAGIAVVESVFIEPGEAADGFPDYPEFVVKPAVGAGSRDTRRHLRQGRAAAIAHVRELLDGGRAVLVQPYQTAVDTLGETALMFFDGEFSHAIRKGPLLQRDRGATELLFAPEQIDPRTPSAAELALARQVLDTLPFATPLYARIDLLPTPDGPRLLELELIEPSLFFQHSATAAARFAARLVARSAVLGRARSLPAPPSDPPREPHASHR